MQMKATEKDRSRNTFFNTMKSDDGNETFCDCGVLGVKYSTTEKNLIEISFLS